MYPRRPYSSRRLRVKLEIKRSRLPIFVPNKFCIHRRFRTSFSRPCVMSVCINIIIYRVVYPVLLKCTRRSIYYINDVIIK